MRALCREYSSNPTFPHTHTHTILSLPHYFIETDSEDAIPGGGHRPPQSCPGGLRGSELLPGPLGSLLGGSQAAGRRDSGTRRWSSPSPPTAEDWGTGIPSAPALLEPGTTSTPLSSLFQGEVGAILWAAALGAMASCSGLCARPGSREWGPGCPESRGGAWPTPGPRARHSAAQSRRWQQLTVT